MLLYPRNKIKYKYQAFVTKKGVFFDVSQKRTTLSQKRTSLHFL